MSLTLTETAPQETSPEANYCVTTELQTFPGFEYYLSRSH